MSNDTPRIAVNVDVTNPGQFFACCGLLELASRIDPYTVAHFENGQFVMSADIRSILEQFFRCDVEVDTSVSSSPDEDEDDGEDESKIDELNPHRGRTYPMTLGAPFHLRLDWWKEKAAQKQKLKTWTPGQRVTDLLVGFHHGNNKKAKYTPPMRKLFEDVVKNYPDDWLRKTGPINNPSSFSYDSRLSRNNALDLGHVTINTMAFSPAVDVLTLIGLQRFRPKMITVWVRNQYCTWSKPLPVQVAAVAAQGVIPYLIGTCFEFPIKPRDAQGRYKLFGHAQSIRRHHD